MLLTKNNPSERELFSGPTGFKGLDRIISNFMEERGSLLSTDWHPFVSSSECKDSYHINVDLPGVKKEDIDVNVKNGYMTISGERKESKKTEDEKILRVESSYGRFERGFALPENADVENVKAECKSGVLEILIPKLEPSDIESKKISID